MKFRRVRQRKVRADVNMTPFIDVVFLLILFFMLSSTFVVQSSIEIQTPRAMGATKLDTKDVTVTVAYGSGGPDGNGAVYVDSVEISTMEELSRILSEKVADDPELRVLVRADKRTEAGRLVEVMGIATSVGVQNYGIAAQPPGEE